MEKFTVEEKYYSIEDILDTFIKDTMSDDSYELLKMILFVDYDDVAVIDSAKWISTEVAKAAKQYGVKYDENDITIKTLEQTKRNCEYLLKKVSAECEKAKLENRMPDLSDFPTFEAFDFIITVPFDYDTPKKMCEKYLKIINELIGRYLEERDTFLEIDNLPKGRAFDFDPNVLAENRAKYENMVNEYRAIFRKINAYCAKEVDRTVNDNQDLIKEYQLTYANKNPQTSEEKFAKQKAYKKIIEIYDGLIDYDHNDVVKGDSNSSFDEMQILIENPLMFLKECDENLDKCIDDINYNARVFTLKSLALIDYEGFYVLDNVDWSVLDFVLIAIRLGLVEASFFASHHTGPREDKAKSKLKDMINEKLKGKLPQDFSFGYIGQLFHDKKHSGNRRDRSDKFERALDFIKSKKPHLFKKIKKLSQFVLLDDSLYANCKIWTKDHEGMAIHRNKPKARDMICGVPDSIKGICSIADFADTRAAYNFIDFLQIYIHNHMVKKNLMNSRHGINDWVDVNSWNVLIDCDGVVVDSVSLLEERRGLAKYEASNEFYNDITEKFNSATEKFNNGKMDTSDYEDEKDVYTEGLRIFADAKNEVLAGKNEEYNKIMDYYSIYTMDNVFEGVIDKIIELYLTGKCRRIVFTTAYNAEEEKEAKNNLFREIKAYIKERYPNIPDIIDIMFIPFSDRYGNKIDKYSYAFDKYGIIDTHNTAIIDDRLDFIDWAGVYSGIVSHRASNEEPTIAFDRVIEKIQNGYSLKEIQQRREQLLRKGVTKVIK